ncbi:MAG TPA: tetratricopeptide repeat protein [Blastocatellia bacterium]|nr:tetratricopeptide repeat protein [Blastocatellia bacterium]HKE05097.1 tetratricopeptide repeat protein [Blastocatellia bacterium]
MFIRLLFILCSFSICALAQQPNAAQMERLAEEGERALAERRYDDAVSAFEKLRQLSPGTAEIHARLGLIYYQKREFAKAVPTLRQAIKLKPTLPNLDVLLAMSLSELGQYTEALPGLQKGFKQSADPALKRASGLQLQRAYTGLRQDDKAVEVALELTRAYPKDPEVLYHAGRLFGNYAYLSTVKLAEVAPDSLWLHLAAGEANESQGRADAAIQEYKEVLSLQPDRSGVHYRIGRTLLARAKQSTDDTVSEAEALKEFERELQLDPTNANAAYEAGEIHRKSARFDKALEMFSQAVKYYPDFEEALLGLSRALLSSGKAEQALAPLRKAISLNAANEVSWFQLAQAQRALGAAEEQQKALAEFERLRELKARQAENNGLTRREVTKQSLDTKPPQE